MSSKRRQKVRLKETESMKLEDVCSENNNKYNKYKYFININMLVRGRNMTQKWGGGSVKKFLYVQLNNIF